MDIDYGPLAGLIGTWTGSRGLDVAPEPDGIQINPYYESATFDPAGEADNASTIEYRHELIIEADRLIYEQTTLLDIFGQRFDHTDKTVLTRS